VPPGRLHTSTGSSHQPAEAALASPVLQLGSVGQFQPLGILWSPVSTSRFPKPRYEPLHVFLSTAVAQRRVWVITLPLSCRRRCEPSPLGQSEPPGRRPPDARSLHLRPLRCRSFLCRFGSGDSFHRSRGFPKSSRLRLSAAERRHKPRYAAFFR
jgi:hypothetical protein